MLATDWTPDLLQAEPLCWPLWRAAEAFRSEPAFPKVAEWSALARARGLPEPGVRFEVQAPRPRRAKRSADRLGYDESIVVHGVVPSRERCWHDLLNFLVWHTFPRSKALLHRRQFEALRAEREQVPLGHSRSRERDTLALLDEGGALVATCGGERRIAPFGHALYEQRLLAPRPTTALCVNVDLGRALVAASVPADADWLAALDAALSSELARPSAFLEPRDYPRLQL